jgi:hypothetical protein
MPNLEQSKDGVPHKDAGRPSPDGDPESRKP